MAVLRGAIARRAAPASGALGAANGNPLAPFGGMLNTASAPAPLPVAAPPPMPTPQPNPTGQLVNQPPPQAFAPPPQPDIPQAPPLEVAGPIQAPDINTYIAGDTDYQTAMSGYQSELARQQVANTNQHTQYDVGYNNSKHGLEQQKAKTLQNLVYEFAAKNGLQSGGYSDAQGQVNNDFNAQQNALDNQRTTTFNGYDTGLQDYQAQNGVLQQNALADAVRRRAAQYGLGG